jgi:hypothetical protein
VGIRPRGDGEEEEGEKEGGVGKTSCRLHLVSIGEGVPTVFKYLVCRIHQHETMWLYTRRLKIARGREPTWGPQTRVSMHARRESTHPSLTLAHHASPDHPLERREVGERRGELGESHFFFPVKTL